LSIVEFVNDCWTFAACGGVLVCDSAEEQLLSEMAPPTVSAAKNPTHVFARFMSKS